jgi:GDPmannose 4,6-dehydratase
MSSTIAVITGVTGQDGAYLAQLLLEKGYSVFGTYRRTSSVNFWRIEELGIYRHPKLKLIEHDLTDLGSSIRLLDETQPDEVYNLAAQTFVAVSFQQPVTTGNINGMGAVHLLEAIRIVNPKIRFYQASTSEMFGKVQAVPQCEDTAFYPRSPYGVAKLYAHWMTINYRESYDIFGVSGILFNHESPLRGLEFVTRKITDGIAKIKLGMQDTIELGNLSSMRDWGYAKDYVNGMHAMLQADRPGEYVLATGRTLSVREFVEMCCKAVHLPIRWKGEGLGEVGIDDTSGKTIIRINPKYYRPAEVDLLVGNPQKAFRELGWKAETSVETLCEIMMRADLRRNRNPERIFLTGDKDDDNAAWANEVQLAAHCN